MRRVDILMPIAAVPRELRVRNWICISQSCELPRTVAATADIVRRQAMVAPVDIRATAAHEALRPATVEVHGVQRLATAEAVEAALPAVEADTTAEVEVVAAMHQAVAEAVGAPAAEAVVGTPAVEVAMAVIDRRVLSGKWM